MELGFILFRSTTTVISSLSLHDALPISAVGLAADVPGGSSAEPRTHRGGGRGAGQHPGPAALLSPDHAGHVRQLHRPAARGGHALRLPGQIGRASCRKNVDSLVVDNLKSM